MTQATTRSPRETVERFLAVAVPTGRSFTNRYIMVVTVRDGLIVHSRDYANPLGSAAAFGTLDRIVQAARGSA